MKGARQLTQDKLLQVAMPMGGIGAGSICFNGHGGLQDFSIRNRPDTTALPDGHGTMDAGFGLVHIKGRQSATRLCEGPFPPGKIYHLGLKAQGLREGGYEGLPRFRKCTFKGAFPFGTVFLADPSMPLSAKVTAFSPFIPLDDKNTSLPCIILEYTFKNTSSRVVSFEFSYHLSHLAEGSLGTEHLHSRLLPGRGVFMYNDDSETSDKKGSAALLSLEGTPRIKAMWYRGGWFDPVSVLWRECSTGAFSENAGNAGLPLQGRSGGSILLESRLHPGESCTFPLAIAWHFPNVSYSVAGFTTQKNTSPLWHPYYTSLFKDAGKVAEHLYTNYASLRQHTVAFRDALFSSTLPAEALDAVSANLAILRSPTVLRQQNGNVWAWEGCFCSEGCCPGSCTHVWNYAQAMPHLFPALERTLREQELCRSMFTDGMVAFRASLPDGPPGAKRSHAAADGQLGGILKVYREWQISGDNLWLRQIYPNAKKSLDFCIRYWDPKREGVIREPHHNTYDIEFWGPESMCSSIYLGALAALSAMARHLGRIQESKTYDALARRGAAYLDKKLFNGQYYFQKVMWKELRDKSLVRKLQKSSAALSESELLIKKEGPHYQYGTGCLSDAVIGAWMASLYGLKIPASANHVRKTLLSIFKNNFRKDLFDHANPQRPGYAMGHEAGLLVCTWPKGGKPTLPFPYSDEVWTGMEYQVASHLIYEGFIKEGMTIVKAVRARYDGAVRNPWNEYECGSYYARAMASYALLQAFSGFRYSAVDQRLEIAPRIKRSIFRTFISTATGWGILTVEKKKVTLLLNEGVLLVKKLCILQNGRKKELSVNLEAKAGIPVNIRV